VNVKRYDRTIEIITVMQRILSTRLFVIFVLWKIGYIMDKYISKFKTTNIVKDIAGKRSSVTCFSALPKQSSIS
jgi:hypothetical protein